MKKQKVTLKQFEMAVREARTFISDYNSSRWKIVTLALSVCERKSRGNSGAGKNVFTVTKFANEIGLKPSTLLNWIVCKEHVLDKLPRTMTRRPHQLSYETIRNVKTMVKPEYTDKEVLACWRQYEKLTPEDIKWNHYLTNINTLNYNASRPMLMAPVSTHIIQQAIQKLDLVSTLLKKELEFRVKYPVDKRVEKKSAQIHGAIREAKEVRNDMRFKK